MCLGTVDEKNDIWRGPLHLSPAELLTLSSVELDVMVSMGENGGKPGLEPVLCKRLASSYPGLVLPLARQD